MKLFVLALVLLAGCSATAEPDLGPKFDDEAQAELTCMRHQSTTPGPRYLEEANWDTDITLPLLRYYTANGRKAYCDGQGPGDVDRDWVAVYVVLGGDEENVRALRS